MLTKAVSNILILLFSFNNLDFVNIYFYSSWCTIYFRINFWYIAVDFEIYKSHNIYG